MKGVQEEIEWLDNTQGSADSEDTPAAYLELLKKIQADKAKKKRKQEAQVLTTVKKNLDISIKNAALGLNGVIVDMENKFETMIVEYGEIDDSIRKLWNELLDEQEHFVALCDAKASAFQLIQEQREERHDGATRAMKAACKEMGRAIQHIHPDQTAQSKK